MSVIILSFVLSASSAQHVPVATRMGVVYAEFTPDAKPCRCCECVREAGVFDWLLRRWRKPGTSTIRSIVPDA